MMHRERTGAEQKFPASVSLGGPNLHGQIELSGNKRVEQKEALKTCTTGDTSNNSRIPFLL